MVEIHKFSRKTRIIDQLRREIPGEWKYNQKTGVWEGQDFNVLAFSSFSPQWDGDESYSTIYLRSDNGKQLYLS